MIDIEYWNPGRWRMAVFANVGGQCVLRILTGRDRTVMTTDAVSGDVCVIVICRQPCNRRMAVIAIVAAGDMRRMLACRGVTVVTGAATTKNLGMVDAIGWHPHGRVVTILTHVGGLNVNGIFASRRSAVMTVNTASNDVGVIEVGRKPPGCRMTIFT